MSYDAGSLVMFVLWFWHLKAVLLVFFSDTERLQIIIIIVMLV